MLKLPKTNTYLWRYIKPERIDSFLDGNLYFSPISSFDDRQESTTPLHSFMLKFIKNQAGLPFDLKNDIHEQDAETMIGTILMWLNITELEKKLLETELFRDEEEMRKFITFYIENPAIYIKEITELQNKYYASCWFASGLDESSLMWTSYSQSGGIAVRIPYLEFRNKLRDYFKTINYKTNGIKSMKYGLMYYIDHDFDFIRWTNLIRQGVPLPFFKQHYFKQEKEFRVVIERDDNFPIHEFCSTYSVFSDFSDYDIILHPATDLDTLEYIRGRIPSNKKRNVHLSKMSFNNRIAYKQIENDIPDALKF